MFCLEVEESAVSSVNSDVKFLKTESRYSHSFSISAMKGLVGSSLNEIQHLMPDFFSFSFISPEIFNNYINPS